VTLDELTASENDSIRAFVQLHASLLTGRVLDLGCGRSPYRSIVDDGGGDYVGYDRANLPANMSGTDIGPDYGDLAPHSFDAVLSTQVIQFHEEPFELLLECRSLLRDRGALVMTGPTCWPEVNPEDLFRFTRNGIAFMLREAGFEVAACVERRLFDLGEVKLAYGWGVVAFA
jgi:SAM-dependent methyltransferase